MVSQVVKLWAAVLLLASLHKCDNAVVSENPSPAKSSCLSEVGAILDAPPIQCKPLVACNREKVLKSYYQLYENCRINASMRLSEREHFLFRINYWQGDHQFLYGLIEKAHESHQHVLDAEYLSHRGPKMIPELNLKLLIYSIEAGRIEDALLLYLTMKNPWTPQQLVKVIVEHPNSVSEVAVLHLLEFARGLPLKSTRADLYKALVPVLGRHELYTSYVLLLYAGDAAAVFTSPKEKADYITNAVFMLFHNLRKELRNLQFDFNVWLANKYPRYYTLYLDDIYTFPHELWDKIEKRRLFEIASMFNAKGHRFQVIEKFLKYVKIYDNRNVYKRNEILPTLALEVDKLESTVKQTGYSKQELDRITKIQDGFKIITHDHKQIYRIYLNNIKVNGKLGKQRLEMQKHG
uniref:Salivary gland protein 1-like n=1 Tax=Anopheles funestus TaxID=62324 RepID=A0A1I8JUD9_ANOFN